MKKLLVVAVALFGLGAGEAMAREDVVIERWPTSSYNKTSATTLVDESMPDGTVNLNVKLASADLAVYGSTAYTATATPFFDNKFVIPFTAMGFTSPNKARVIVVTTRDGSATDYNYVSWTANNGGASVEGAYYGKAIMIGAAPGTIYQHGQRKEYPLSHGASGYGTLYIASPIAAAAGISTFQVEVYGTK